MTKTEILQDNKGLVISIAKRYQHKGLDMDDLIQEGYIGLLTAIDKYDESKETKLSTYASYWIRQAIVRAIENTGSLVRIPSHANKLENNKYSTLESNITEMRDIQKHSELLDKVRDIITDDKEYCMYIDYHVMEKSLRDIAQEYNTSHETVRTTLATLTKRIRKALTS